MMNRAVSLMKQPILRRVSSSKWTILPVHSLGMMSYRRSPMEDRWFPPPFHSHLPLDLNSWRMPLPHDTSLHDVAGNFQVRTCCRKYTWTYHSFRSIRFTVPSEYVARTDFWWTTLTWLFHIDRSSKLCWHELHWIDWVMISTFDARMTVVYRSTSHLTPIRNIHFDFTFLH